MNDPDDLAYFLAGARLASIALTDVARVEAACWVREPFGARYGYILLLTNSRRILLSVSGRASDAIFPTGVAIAELLRGVARPNLGLTFEPYWYEPVLINQRLEMR